MSPRVVEPFANLGAALNKGAGAALAAMRQRAAIYTVGGVTVLALIGVGLAAGRVLGKRGEAFPSVQQYALMRGIVVDGHLAQARPGFILWTGDSHVELAMLPSLPCDRDQVSAGISGARMADTLAFIRALHVPQTASVAVLTIGTNDLLRKNAFSNPTKADAVIADAERAITTLKQQGAKTVLVNAPPPVSPTLAWAIDPEHVELLSRRLEEVCNRQGCLFQDPFAELRSIQFGVAIAGATKDGQHLADYRHSYRHLVPHLCS